MAERQSDDTESHTETLKLKASMIVCQDKGGLIHTHTHTHLYKHHLPPTPLQSRLAGIREGCLSQHTKPTVRSDRLTERSCRASKAVIDLSRN